jgi:hypothetical protein
MTLVHGKSEIKCNISSRLSFIIEKNCVLYVVSNRTEDKVVDRNTKSRKVKDINPLNAELNPICHLLVLLRYLTFMGPCIVSIFQYTSILDSNPRSQ